MSSTERDFREAHRGTWNDALAERRRRRRRRGRGRDGFTQVMASSIYCLQYKAVVRLGKTCISATRAPLRGILQCDPLSMMPALLPSKYTTLTMRFSRSRSQKRMVVVTSRIVVVDPARCCVSLTALSRHRNDAHVVNLFHVCLYGLFSFAAR